jgi:hypothetical protein
MAYSVTDTDLIKDITYHLLENGNANATGTTLITSIWSITKIVNALNQRQDQFLKETNLILTRANIAAVPQQPRYAAPTDCVSILRVTWENTDGDIKALIRTDAWQLDQGLTDWGTDYATPVAWQESTSAALTFDIAKAPDDAGAMTMLYTALGTTLTGLGVTMSIPDEWSPYIKWGALADLLASDGAGCDPTRAAYCESRFQEGVELGKTILRSLGGVRG